MNQKRIYHSGTCLPKPSSYRRRWFGKHTKSLRKVTINFVYILRHYPLTLGYRQYNINSVFHDWFSIIICIGDVEEEEDDDDGDDECEWVEEV